MKFITMKLKTLEMTFRSTEVFKESTECMRGFFASKFNEFIQLHNHNTDKFVYDYPLIQYKFIGIKPLVIGINEGTEVLKEVFDAFDTIRLGQNDYEIVQRSMTIRKQDFGLSDKIHFYEFLTPWFSLNKKNYERFGMCRSEQEQISLLRKILIGNLVSMSKTFGYTVDAEIKCDLDVNPTESIYKDTEFTSFYGGFMTNFMIPDYLGIGKAVAMGKGTVRKIRVYRQE